MIFGRKEEMEILKAAYESADSQFVAIYGRRRVGKTFLVRETFAGKIDFQHAGVAKGGQSVQIAAFVDSLREQGAEVRNVPKNWIEAFSLLKDRIKKSRAKKKVVFLDELSWMAAGKSGLLNALEFFWNSWASARKDVLLIVSSSATSWMLNKIVCDKGGFYHRLNHKIGLRPFTLAECKDFASRSRLSMSKDEILRAYMVFGGVPYYWTLLKRGDSIMQNVDRLCFQKNGELKDELDYLLRSLFAKPEPYLSIVLALGKSKQGLSRSEIIKEAHLSPGGDVSTMLKELAACEYIREYLPFGKKKKESVYQLVDPFVLFYLRFMEKSSTDEHFMQNNVQAAKVMVWEGLAFEMVCLLHVPQMKEALGIAGVATEVSSWRCQANEDLDVAGHQIDLLIDRSDNLINICEMKYSSSPYVVKKKDALEWYKRVQDFLTMTKTGKSVIITLVTPYGLKWGEHASVVQKTLILDDLFR